MAYKLPENGLIHGIDTYCVQISIFNKERETVNFLVPLRKYCTGKAFKGRFLNSTSIANILKRFSKKDVPPQGALLLLVTNSILAVM